MPTQAARTLGKVIFDKYKLTISHRAQSAALIRTAIKTETIDWSRTPEYHAYAPAVLCPLRRPGSFLGFFFTLKSGQKC